MMNDRLPSMRYLILAFFLVLPACLPSLAHYLVTTGTGEPTGFFVYDFAYYLACAREYFDSGHFHLTYGNPCSYLYTTPRIYFQPLTLLTGVLLYVTKWDPGTVLHLIGAGAGLFSGWAAILLYRHLVGLASWAHKLGLFLFFWGGGALTLAGMGTLFFQGNPGGNIFMYDPMEGLWCLNFGRNLIFPTEAFYHALFFLCILLAMKKKWAPALTILAIVSISHPFTGIQLITILSFFACFERFFMKNHDIPLWFLFSCSGVLVFHCLYYLVFLNQFPEHRQLVSQWALPWFFRAKHFIPAYILVGGLALWRIRRLDLAGSFFSQSRNRMLFIWFTAAFLMANHEFAIRPMQPLHFTRGYIWVPLFFIGIDILIKLFHFLKSRLKKTLGLLSILSITGLFIMDNGFWLTSFFQAHSPPRKKAWEIRMIPEQKELLTWMNSLDKKGLVVVSQDIVLSYLVTVYTPFRSWYSHIHNTPYSKKRLQQLNKLFSLDHFHKAWDNIPVLIVYLVDHSTIKEKKPTWMSNQQVSPVFENSTFLVFQVD
jgi:hypothetical protein